jgi:hypothetical protein
MILEALVGDREGTARFSAGNAALAVNAAA